MGTRAGNTIVADVGLYRTVSGVPYDELAPGYTFGYTLRGNESRETRVRKLAATNLPIFLKDMLGATTPRGPQGSLPHTVLDRQLPDTIGWQMWCTDVEFVQGLAPGTTGRLGAAAGSGWIVPINGPRFNEVIVACHYQAVPYDVATNEGVRGKRVPELQRFVTREIDFAVESVAVPGGAFKWQTVTTPPGVAEDLFEPPAKMLNTATLQYTWHHVDQPRIDAINAIRGCVNDRAFDDEPGYYPIRLRNHPAETLLFAGAKLEPVKDLGGNWRFNVIYQFLQRNNGLLADGVTYAGWNHLYRPRTQKFERVVDKATGTYGIYRTASFDTLFFPALPF
ncbi:MAG: hypothetical protein IT429_26435 [Gemmataceae bacterium]|nr:hypothetical protein [Gemmataceae bacterium]